MGGKAACFQILIPCVSLHPRPSAFICGWIPSGPFRLIEDYVWADKWKLLVAYAFRTPGCHVEIRGNLKPGIAKPDCIARCTSPAGRILELIIGAKAGRWNWWKIHLEMMGIVW